MSHDLDSVSRKVGYAQGHWALLTYLLQRNILYSLGFRHDAGQRKTRDRAYSESSDRW